MTRMIEDCKLNEEVGYVLITRVAFKKGETQDGDSVNANIKLPGKLSKILLNCWLNVDPAELKNYIPDPQFVNGIKGQLITYSEDSSLKNFAKVNTIDEGFDSLEIFKMPPSMCILLSFKFSQKQAKIIQELNSLQYPSFDNLSLAGLNHILYRCQNEEQDISSKKRWPYAFKNLVPKFAGIAGYMYEILKGKNTCPIYDNIKEGNWLIEYTINRINEIAELKDVSNWLTKYLSPVKDFYSELKPKYFAIIISKSTTPF